MSLSFNRLLYRYYPSSLGMIWDVKLPSSALAQLYLSPCEMGSVTTCYAKGSSIGGPQVFQSSGNCPLGSLPRGVSKEEAVAVSTAGHTYNRVQRERPGETHLPMLQGAPR